VEKMKIKIYFYLVFFLINLSPMVAQSNEILFKKKSFGKDFIIQISLSSPEGSDTPDTGKSIKQQSLFFTARPLDNLSFKDKDLSNSLFDLKLVQSTQEITPVEINPIFENDKIIAAVITYPLDSFLWTDSFNFKYNESVTGDMGIAEEFWPEFTKYSGFLTQADENFSDMDYLSSIVVLLPFLTDDDLITSFSFYSAALDKLFTYFEAFFVMNQNSYNELLEKSTNQLDENLLDDYGQFLKKVEEANNVLTPLYLFETEPRSAEVKQSFSQFLQTVDSQTTNASEQFKHQLLTIFETGNYQDYKFKLYMNLILKLVTNIGSIKKVEGFTPLDIALLDNFETQKSDLIDLEWYDEFIAIVNLLNEDIQNGQLLSTVAFENILNQSEFEQQPYYTILLAFDFLCKRDLEQFSEKLQISFETCTDSDLLYTLETWYMSIMVTRDDINDNVLASLNKGLEFEEAGEFASAEQEFKKVIKLSGNFAPPLFYLGRVNHKKEEFFVAERYFTQALEKYPQYLAPSIYRLNFFIDSAEYAQAMVELDMTLEKSPYWYFYYLKAQILYELMEYENSTAIIMNSCLSLNDDNFDQYILLGDNYIGLENLEDARLYYQKAGAIDPENEIYSQKMSALQKLKAQMSEPEIETE